MMDKLSAGDWIEGLQGLGQVIAANDLYYESWQRIPETAKAGDVELTMIIWRMLCTYSMKRKVQMMATNAKLCNRIDVAQNDHIQTLLKDSNTAKKFHECRIPPDFGNVHSFTFDIEKTAAGDFVGRVEMLGDLNDDLLTYEDICRRIPDFRSHLHEISPDVKPNRSRLVVLLLNPMFRTDECGRRVLRFLRITG